MYRVILMVLMTLSFSGYSAVPTPSDFNLASYEHTFSIKSGEISNVSLFFAEDDDDLQNQWQYWNQDAESHIANQSVAGFALVKGDNCIIVLNKFDSWDDIKSMAILGHELLHCMGAEHDDPIR